MACETCDLKIKSGNPPCNYHRIGSSNLSRGGNTKTRSVVFDRPPFGSKTIYEKIYNFIEDNPGHSASPQQLNRKLQLNINPSTMASYIRTMKENGKIAEPKGRYYIWSAIPKEMEQFL